MVNAFVHLPPSAAHAAEKLGVAGFYIRYFRMLGLTFAGIGFA